MSLRIALQLTQVRGGGMDRRRFVALIDSALAAPFVRGQVPGKIRRIGVVQILERKLIEEYMQAFEAGLRDLGWVNGRNLAIEYRFAGGKVEGVPALARELEQLGVELIVTGTNPGNQGGIGRDDPGSDRDPAWKRRSPGGLCRQPGKTWRKGHGPELRPGPRAVRQAA
jgi:hypothetical protein